MHLLLPELFTVFILLQLISEAAALLYADAGTLQTCGKSVRPLNMQEMGVIERLRPSPDFVLNDIKFTLTAAIIPWQGCFFSLLSSSSYHSIIQKDRADNHISACCRLCVFASGFLPTDVVLSNLASNYGIPATVLGVKRLMELETKIKLK